MAKEQFQKKLDVLIQLSSTINSSLHIKEVLRSAMNFVEDLIGAEMSSIFELDEEKNELFFRIIRGENAHKAREIRMKMGEGIAGRVASSGEPVIVGDTKTDKRYSPKVDALTGIQTKSIAALPITNKGRIIGVLEVLNKKGGDSFTDDDLDLLTLVANQIGIAMVNATLYERLQEEFTLTREELKVAQAQLLRSERLTALALLSRGVAHEVRNPVMSIGGFAGRLKKRLQNDDQAMSYVDIILKETGRLEQMVKDIEQYTAMPEPVFRPAKISEIIENVQDEWSATENAGKLNIEVKFPSEDITISVDKVQLTQALTCLLENVSEAMPDGGTVIISTLWENNGMAISVKDQGIGIDPEDLPHIFDPFFTSKTKGSGLGLTTVNRIVSDHGGEVNVFSEPGSGTEVKLCIPRFQNHTV